MHTSCTVVLDQCIGGENKNYYHNLVKRVLSVWKAYSKDLKALIFFKEQATPLKVHNKLEQHK